ncbi:Hypothetical protein NocV09_01201950 [Nannochloropsis oceanica]
MDEDTSEAIWSQATAVARCSRRKTLSPSKALGFLAASIKDSSENQASNSNFDGSNNEGNAFSSKLMDIENCPPAGPMQPRRDLPLSKAGSIRPALVPAFSSSFIGTPNKARKTNTAASLAKESLFHSPVYMTWAKGGGRQAGEMRQVEEGVGAGGVEVGGGMFWWCKGNAASSSSAPGGMRDITNRPLMSRQLVQKDGEGRLLQQQQEEGEKEEDEKEWRIVFEAGKVLSASFVWLDSQTPGLSVVLVLDTEASAREGQGEEGREEGVGETSVAFFDFQGKGAEEAARKALDMLQDRMAENVAPVPLPPPTAAAVAAAPPSSTTPVAPNNARSSTAQTDLPLLIRRFLQAPPHSFAAKHVARQVFEATGYPLLSFGLIPAAASSLPPSPLPPRTTLPAMSDMRKMVLSLEPIIKGMTEVHQAEIRASEARTGARARRRKAGEEGGREGWGGGAGCYEYVCLETGEKMNPWAYRERYLKGLEEVAEEGRERRRRRKEGEGEEGTEVEVEVEAEVEVVGEAGAVVAHHKKKNEVVMEEGEEALKEEEHTRRMHYQLQQQRQQQYEEQQQQQQKQQEKEEEEEARKKKEEEEQQYQQQQRHQQHERKKKSEELQHFQQQQQQVKGEEGKEEEDVEEGGGEEQQQQRKEETAVLDVSEVEVEVELEVAEEEEVEEVANDSTEMGRQMSEQDEEGKGEEVVVMQPPSTPLLSPLSPAHSTFITATDPPHSLPPSPAKAPFPTIIAVEVAAAAASAAAAAAAAAAESMLIDEEDHEKTKERGDEGKEAMGTIMMVEDEKAGRDSSPSRAAASITSSSFAASPSSSTTTASPSQISQVLATPAAFLATCSSNLSSSSSSSGSSSSSSSNLVKQGRAGVGQEEVDRVGEEAEVKLHLAIDEALRRYHHEVSCRHAALVGRKMREVRKEGDREEER